MIDFLNPKRKGHVRWNKMGESREWNPDKATLFERGEALCSAGACEMLLFQS